MSGFKFRLRGQGPAGSAPVNTLAPAISGIETVGQTLTTTNGAWSPSASSYAYQWNNAGVAIGGATSSTYVLQAGDAGDAITCTVTASNGYGSAAATSNSVTPAAALSISGTPSATGTAGSSYSFTPTTAGGHAAYSYALTGTLPGGLSFNTSTGAITGTPTTEEVASGLNITVTDADGLTAALGVFSITVSAAVPADTTTTLRTNDNQIIDMVSALSTVPDGTRVTLAVSGTVAAQVWPYAPEADWITDGQSRAHDKRYLLYNLAAITRSASTGTGVGTWTFTAAGGFSYVHSFDVSSAAPTEWDYGAKSLAQYGGFPIAQYLAGTASDWTIQSQSTSGAFTINTTTNCVAFAGTLASTTRTVGTPTEGTGAYTVTLANATLGTTHTISFNIIANRWDVDCDPDNTRIGTTIGKAMNYGDEVVINDPTTWGAYNNPTRANPGTFFTAGARSQRVGGPAAPTGPYVGNSWEPQNDRNEGWITVRPRTPWAVNLNRFQITPPTGGYGYVRYHQLDNRNNATPSTSSIIFGHSGNQMHYYMVDSCITSGISFGQNQTTARSALFAVDNYAGHNPAIDNAETNGISLTGLDSQIVGNLIDGVTNDGIIYCLLNSTYGSGKSKLWWNMQRNKRYANTGIHGDFMQIYGVGTVFDASVFTNAANADKIYDMATELGNVCFRGDGTIGDGSSAHGGAGNVGKDIADGQGSWAGDWNAVAGSYVARIQAAGMIYVGTFLGGIGRKWAAPGTTVKQSTLLWPEYLTNVATGMGMSSPSIRLLGVGGKISVADSLIANAISTETNDTVATPTPATDNNITGFGTDSSAVMTSPNTGLASAQYLEEIIDALTPIGAATTGGGATRTVGAVGSGLIDHLQRTYTASVLDPIAGAPTTQATWDTAAVPSGTPTVGQVLTATAFNWDDTVTTLTRGWYRHDVSFTFTGASLTSGSAVATVASDPIAAGVQVGDTVTGLAGVPSATTVLSLTTTTITFNKNATATTTTTLTVSRAAAQVGTDSTTFTLTSAETGAKVGHIERVEDSQGNRIAAVSSGVLVTA